MQPNHVRLRCLPPIQNHLPLNTFRLLLLALRTLPLRIPTNLTRPKRSQPTRHLKRLRPNLKLQQLCLWLLQTPRKLGPQRFADWPPTLLPHPHLSSRSSPGSSSLSILQLPPLPGRSSPTPRHLLSQLLYPHPLQPLSLSPDLLLRPCIPPAWVCQ
jgi:hypothetical protein